MCFYLKDSSMISSALHHYFANVAREELREFHRFRLFAVSYFGRNKNINVLSMLCALRKQELLYLDIQFFFPVHRHSFLPADRVFDKIEKEIRKKGNYFSACRVCFHSKNSRHRACLRYRLDCLISKVNLQGTAPLIEHSR